MFEFDANDVVTSLRKAKNINSAIKNFLKKEMRAGVEGERFVKDLRDRLLSSNVERAKSFVEPQLPRYAAHLLGIGRYAFSEMVLPVSEEIVDKYADSFNASYVKENGEVVIKDEKTFTAIVKATLERAEQQLTSSGIEATPFMKSLFMVGIFEEEVLKKIKVLLC